MDMRRIKLTVHTLRKIYLYFDNSIQIQHEHYISCCIVEFTDALLIDVMETVHIKASKLHGHLHREHPNRTEAVELFDATELHTNDRMALQ
ncbi:hypothetical protein KIN20_013459 [Parelaphostrongylus tenuis]|uniref:Uncharacterized protein n=1 Tax=Parelaphostrongylus tenuis TaxID=148309 RepID=A0AAD5MXI8_PARTN|nr:hypothetical protein KIN20_013459 [Parelaphostrongylus tenuis]